MDFTEIKKNSCLIVVFNASLFLSVRKQPLPNEKKTTMDCRIWIAWKL